MEKFAWRYQPEFIVAVLVNGQPATGLEVLPPAGEAPAGSGFIVRRNGSRLACFGRQLLKGTDWVPVHAFTRPLSFSFWIRVMPGNAFRIAEIFNDPAVLFGKPVFYADNLSPSGQPDAGLTGNVLELIPDPLLVDEHKAALSTHLPEATINPGEYTAVKAGKIRPGGAVAFQGSSVISPTQTEARLDFRSSPGDARLVVLEGSPDVQEQVIPDEAALAAGAQGIVTIYRDSWRAPAPPIEYRINFIT